MESYIISRPSAQNHLIALICAGTFIANLAAGINHVGELAPGFFNAFLFGAAVSLAAIALMLAVGKRMALNKHGGAVP